MRIRTVQIGLTDACNLDCRMCTRSRAFREQTGRRAGFMDPALFGRILADLATTDHRYDLLFLAWLGESLLHPDFLALVERAAAAVRNGRPLFPRLSVNTNGTLVTPAFTAGFLAIARAHPELKIHIAFSLDAWSDAAHATVKGGGSAAAVRAGVTNFLADNARDNAVSFHLTFLVLEENHAEAAEFVAGWSAILAGLGLPFRAAYDDSEPGGAENLVVLKRAILPDQPRADQLHREAAIRAGLLASPPPAAGPAPAPAGPAPERKLVRADSISKNFSDHTLFKPQPGRPPCPALWQYPVIHWDGRVTLCCKDTHLDLVVGDLRTQSFREVWGESALLATYRRWHLEGKFHLMPECAHCGNYDCERIAPDDLAQALAEVGPDGPAPHPERREAPAGEDATEERMREFAAVRPERLPEFEKAAHAYAGLGMPREERLARSFFERGFVQYLNRLAGTAPDLAQRHFLAKYEKALNERFDEAVRLHGESGAGADRCALAPLLELDPVGFAAERFPGVSDAVAERPPLDGVYRTLLKKFAVVRDVGNYHWLRNEFGPALAAYRRQLEDDPRDRAALKQAAFSAYHLGDPDAALAYAGRALDLGDDFEMKRLLGHIFLERSDFPAAAAAFESATRLDPADPLSLRGLADALVALKSPAARNALLRLVECAPTPADAAAARERLGRLGG